MSETVVDDSLQSQIRYRSSSGVDLQATDLEYAVKMRKTTRSQEQLSTFSDKVRRNRGVILAVSIPILIVSFVIYVSSPPNAVPVDAGGLVALRNEVEEGSYAVIFDAGSSGSRVHVYSFDRNLNLLPIGNGLELFVQKKPGLSAYASNPKEAAESLNSLLQEAEDVIPSDLQKKTPVRVGATAGLRALGVETSDKILEEVRDFLKEKSSLRSNLEWVTVLDGTQEGAYQWVTINYLLGNLGKGYENTVGVVDLGGGSVQMAYAISEDDALTAPKLTDGEDTYVKELFLKGTKYFLYVHSYMNFGLLAARAEILKTDDDPASSCILAGYNGTYKYGGAELDASASKDGPSYMKCRTAAVEALSFNKRACTHMKCTFGGVWNGGGGDGQKNLFVASYFYDRAAEAGFIDPTEPEVIVKPKEFKAAAFKVCETNMEDAGKNYPRVEAENLPYLCMDLVYQYTLLVDGFGLVPSQNITLVKQVKYGDYLTEAAWPLGSAIEVVSSSF